MKIIAIHGDHIEKSYERLQKLVDVAKSRDWEVVKVSDNGIKISEVIVSKGLFEKGRLVVVENPSFIKKNDIKWIKKRFDDIEANIIIYHTKTLTKTFLKQFPDIYRNEEFKLPVLLWNFLDSFYPGNTHNVLGLMHEINDHEAIEFVFALLSKHVRNMVWVKKDPDGMNLPSWRLGKLKSQSRRFPDGILEEILDDLAKADVKSKTSNSKLIDLLDFIIIDKLK